MVSDIGKSVCIYCKNEGSSREHVAPSSLGGNCTVTFVCQPCNNGLSVVDQALAENSPVTLSKIQHTPQTAFRTQLGGHSSFQDPSGLDVAVRVGNQMQTEIRPQLFLRNGHIQALASGRDGLNDLVAFIDKQIQKKRLQDTRIVNAESAEPHFLMHRSNDALVSCSDSKLAQEFLALLETQWPEIKLKLQEAAEVTVKQLRPDINVKLKFRPNDELRGVAKIAFETAALLLGPEFVLQPEFDPVRNYIKGDVHLPEPLPGEIAVDTRFVQRAGSDFTMNFTQQHGVLLYCSPPSVVAFVCLYGENAYLVRLATMQHEVQWLRCYEFSYAKDGHGEIGEGEFASRLLENAPALFGLGPDRAAELVKAMRAKGQK